MSNTLQQLERSLQSLDNKSYNALKSIQGNYQTDLDNTLFIDYVQGDPFAAPSRIRFRIPLSSTDLTFTDMEEYHRLVAAKHFFSKEFTFEKDKKKNPVRGTGKSGMIFIDTPGQEVIERSAVAITEKYIEFRISCGIPANGRKISGKQAANLLCRIIPSIAEATLENYRRSNFQESLEVADNQVFIRKKMSENGLTAFVSNGSVLPRESGHSNRPLPEKEAVPFHSPKVWEYTFTLTNGRKITGMGIKRGVTLIVGGGYHGKSTLLKAIERGVYNHEKGDGREYVLADSSAVKIRAEDDRSIRNVNISPFINELPMQKKTDQFSSADASGSTSQAAGIMEALEMKSRVLLMDEDTSATNFMIRDARMQKLVKKEKEPITPFIDRIRDLYEQHGVSTILVLGGSGDYFDVADYVVMMDEYRPFDKTKEAKELVNSVETIREKENPITFPETLNRHFPKKIIENKLDRKGKIQARGLHQISIGKNSLPLHAVEQLISESQTEAIAMILKKIIKQNENASTEELIDGIYKSIEEEGLESVSPFAGQHPGNLALPRKFEIAAALNRIRD
ncbi:ABC-ATPase domain-containing protein [Alkalicoccus halolimnae]|uniref:ABC-ATPase domain-containing protein n=1 Tax=Alkalicoccus halolimnae TaxID=1667239 RepID=A0A5C7FR40_9BACI|nr:ABC-ATPase domain-containing protein [Alkalicoccus halolimnae]TXF87175.1 ATPase [Alkalicoccus halolimnae]